VTKAWAPASERRQPENFCLSKCQTDSALGLIVVERDAQVGDVAQDLLGLAVRSCSPK
jgi:hypothetical protein